ncbi:cysteine desulfurase family protein [Methylocystis bryophila]|uniref:Cysteine desulfurase n=1 Tax=Methylocystis bryophila TaxID=655015 RepID=A0A1W6MSL6_9HYPH|nr:aminotransferase class V-fold PLP-dependent enzyme [Methylocystis bryophila]ARN80600.1 cysteine desulfurase [Methylocystis bryophila]BDV40653.1 cysteine desulfurase [Methylocystis bryophila]
MAETRAYLDYNATAPLRPAARAAAWAAMETVGNPSSIHAEGRAARLMLEEARSSLAAGIGAAAENVVFTSGATEAANLALTPEVYAKGATRPCEALLIAGGEHPCVLNGSRFPAESISVLPLEAEGALSLERLTDALRELSGKRVMVALQAANHETGVLQPVREAADLVHAAGGLLVCDASQAMGRRETTLETTHADLLFFSSHKIGGPAGAGVLAFGREDIHISDVLLRGGGQESGRRAGTENLAAVAGLLAALDEASDGLAQEVDRLGALRDEVERRILGTLPQARILGKGAERLPNTTAWVAEGFEARTLAMALDLEGVAVSPGAACSSGKTSASTVLAAMGMRDAASVRVSLGWRTGAKDVELFGIALARVVARIRSRRTAA